MSIIERLTTLFAPDDCLGCGREGSLLCDPCMATLPKPAGRCFGCGIVVEGASCRRCLHQAGLTSLETVADYNGTAKLLVTSLKFRGNRSAARIMAECLARRGLPERCLITNMPATTEHIRQRGFDQAVLIAKQMAQRAGLPYLNVLRRAGRHHQLGANRESRLSQMKDALSVRQDVRGRHVVIIDDVITTGASLHAAATALLQAGAGRVDALVFAQAIKKPD